MHRCGNNTDGMRSPSWHKESTLGTRWDKWGCDCKRSVKARKHGRMEGEVFFLARNGPPRKSRVTQPLPRCCLTSQTVSGPKHAMADELFHASTVHKDGKTRTCRTYLYRKKHRHSSASEKHEQAEALPIALPAGRPGRRTLRQASGSAPQTSGRRLALPIHACSRLRSQQVVLVVALPQGRCDWQEEGIRVQPHCLLRPTTRPCV